MLSALIISVTLNVVFLGILLYAMYSPDSHWEYDDWKERALNAIRPIKWRR